MTAALPDALSPAADDPHSVAVTKLAIAALVGTAVITPASISKRAYEIDGSNHLPRGVSTFTLRNNPSCKALLDDFRTHRQKPAKRHARRVPPHIACLSKPDLLNALQRARDGATRLECALDQITVRLGRFERKVCRTGLAAILHDREALAANQIAGHPPTSCATRPADDAARSLRMTNLALKSLKDGGEKPTQSAVLRLAKALDPKKRGLHDGIFEANLQCAALVRKAAGRAEPGPRSKAHSRALMRLSNHELGLAVWLERCYSKALVPIVSKAADLCVDLELPAVLDALRAEERRFRLDELELAHALGEQAR